MRFTLKSDYQPCGDQPQAIEALVRGLNDGSRDQVLLGITGLQMAAQKRWVHYAE